MPPRIWGVALAFVLALCAGAIAAPPRTVRGVVIERGTPDPIEGASVLSEAGDIAVTDVDGYFTLAIAPTERALTVVADGYAPATVRLARAGTGVIRVELVPTAGGELIEITGTAPEQTQPLSYQLTAEQIRQIPGTGNDVLRAVQALPGVARIPYAFGGLVLRGSSPRDTLVLLDGVEVPLAFHFGGVTSFYPGGMLADLTLTSGGFDASYGRAQGGVVTLTTREPRTDRWRVGGAIGLLDSSVQVEGPLARGGGITIGLRRSYFDTIIAPFVSDDTPLPSYWDFQLRTSWGDPRKGGRISPMIFGSIDRVASDEVAATSAFVRVAAPYHLQRGRLTLHVVPYLGWNQLSFEDREDGHSFARPTYPGGVRAEVTRDHATGHLRGGVELTGGYLDSSQINVSNGDGPSELSGSTTIAWTDLALWAEARWRADGDRFAIKPGLRAELYGLTGELVIDPRLNLHQRLTETLTMRQAIGRFHQPPTPGDIDPENGNPELDSSYVDQISLGLDVLLPRELLVSVTGFYSYGEQLGVRVRNPRPGSDAPEPNLGGLGPTFELLLEKQLGIATYRENLGRARNVGLEVNLKRHVGSWFTMLSYTLSNAQRTEDPRNATGWRPFELDQRHNLQVAVSRQLPRWRFGARLQLVSGNPYSPSIWDGELLRADPWGGNLPAFVSLDLRVDRRWRRCWGDINLYVDIQNVTNRDNVEGREFSYELERDEDIPGLPIIPFIGVELLPLR